MFSSIGKNIRTLRIRRQLTQEQLARLLNISPQAVSKWENEQTLPDLSIIAMLCRALNTSADELLGMDISARDIEDMQQRAMALVESNPAEGRRILSDGLKRYPAAAPLWRALLYVTDYANNPEDTLRAARQLNACARDESDRFDAARFTAYALAAQGDESGALRAAETIPDLTFTRLSELAFLLRGEGRRNAAERQARISFENLLQMLEQAAEYDDSVHDTVRAAARRQKALSLLELMQDEPYAAELDVYIHFFKSRLKQPS